MKSYLVMNASSPSSPQALRCLQVVSDLQSKGHVTLVLMQDAVFAALKTSKIGEKVNRLTRNGSSIYVLAEHLHRRGFLADNLLENVKIADYAQLVELMMDEETSTIGVF